MHNCTLLSTRQPSYDIGKQSDQQTCRADRRFCWARPSIQILSVLSSRAASSSDLAPVPHSPSISSVVTLCRRFLSNCKPTCQVDATVAARCQAMCYVAACAIVLGVHCLRYHSRPPEVCQGCTDMKHVSCVPLQKLQTAWLVSSAALEGPASTRLACSVVCKGHTAVTPYVNSLAMLYKACELGTQQPSCAAYNGNLQLKRA